MKRYLLLVILAFYGYLTFKGWEWWQRLEASAEDKQAENKQR